MARRGRPNSLGLAIELDEDGHAERIADQFDRALQLVNPIYAEHRSGDGIYGPVRVRRLRPGTYQRQLRCQVDRGQFKRRRIFRSQLDFESFHGLG